MKESRIDFAAYYATMPNSSLLANESVRVNDELIFHYKRLADKTADHVRLKRRETKAIKATLESYRDKVLQSGGDTSAHEYSSRIVSIVAQRELQRKKQLESNLQRQAAMGTAGRQGPQGKGKKKEQGKVRAAACRRVGGGWAAFLTPTALRCRSRARTRTTRTRTPWTRRRPPRASRRCGSRKSSSAN